MAVEPQRLLLVQARNLITNLALPGVLTDTDGQLLFYNDAAAVLLGRRFEEVGRLSREEWANEIGPFDDQGRPVAATLEERLARYLSEPLSPVELRELPARVRFAACPHEEWQVGCARVSAAIVAHRGITLGYRITEGGRSLCYLPDHEPALGCNLADAELGWISGVGLARHASVLIHDGQYADEEYPARVGWGHSSISDAVTFAVRADAERLILFHHDPTHDDSQLDRLGERAREAWAATGRDPSQLMLAAENATVTV